MLNENAKKWVAALRSGKYKQTQGTLADEKGYCCLGVACEVAIANGLAVDRTDTSFLSEDKFAVFYDDTAGLLPESVKEWLGLTYIDGQYANDSGSSFSCLSNMNDNGASFEEIAELIESEPPGLFKSEDGD